MLDNEFQQSAGSYRDLLKSESDAENADLENPFFVLFMPDGKTINTWYREHNLLPKTSNCAKIMR